MTPLEKDIEQKLRKHVEERKGLCLKWICPGWAGVPDRIVLLPGGRIYFIELKRPKGGRVSGLQTMWRKWLTDLGFSYRIIWDEDDLAAFLGLIQKEVMP